MKSRFAKKVDRSQSGIVKAMRKFCGQVEITNMGNDFPDLLCAVWRGWKLVEVKEPDGHFSRGQLAFLARSRGPVDIVLSEDDAIISINQDRQLDADEKSKMEQWLIKNPNQETIRVRKLLGIIGRTSEQQNGRRG